MVKHKKVGCVCCGKCCQGIYIKSMPATEADIRRWKNENRYDILEYVAENNSLSQQRYYLWVKNGKELLRCPFLRKDKGKQTYHCTIYTTRPNICKDYPGIGSCLRVRDELLKNADTPKERTTRRIIPTKATTPPVDNQQIKRGRVMKKSVAPKIIRFIQMEDHFPGTCELNKYKGELAELEGLFSLAQLKIIVGAMEEMTKLIKKGTLPSYSEMQKISEDEEYEESDEY